MRQSAGKQCGSMRNEGQGQCEGEGQGEKDEKAEAKDCEMSMDVTLLDKASERVGFLGGHFVILAVG